MLVLSRKVGERVLIGDQVTVVISKIAGNRVTLAIEAPDSMHIIRAELPPEERERFSARGHRGGAGSTTERPSISESPADPGPLSRYRAAMMNGVSAIGHTVAAHTVATHTVAAHAE